MEDVPTHGPTLTHWFLCCGICFQSADYALLARNENGCIPPPGTLGYGWGMRGSRELYTCCCYNELSTYRIWKNNVMQRRTANSNAIQKFTEWFFNFSAIHINYWFSTSFIPKLSYLMLGMGFCETSSARFVFTLLRPTWGSDLLPQPEEQVILLLEVVSKPISILSFRPSRLSVSAVWPIYIFSFKIVVKAMCTRNSTLLRQI